MYFQLIKEGKNSIGLVWDYKNNKSQIKKVYLPEPQNKILFKIKRDFPAIGGKQRKIGNGTDRLVINLFKGKNHKIDLSLLDMKNIKPFAAKVLAKVCKIPHGKVTTYSGLALKIGEKGAARAVGTVMGNNPFPIIIPCHRVIRADGTLGGFGGGLKMKSKMLKNEGIVIDNQCCRVSSDYFW